MDDRKNGVGQAPIDPARPRVVIVGGGFGGLQAARVLGRAPVDVTVIDRTNHHVFQPLLYQVATASLSPGQITAPIRGVLKLQRNTEVLMAEVTGVEPAGRRVLTRDRAIEYDYLVLATGSRHSYFGHPEWEVSAPGLKAISDATSVRCNILLAFEAAEMEPDPDRRRGLLTFVLVGGGPTGVEMAGQVAEIAHRAFKSDFRHFDPSTARIILVEAGPRILPGFHESLSQASHEYLKRMRVEVWTGRRVENVQWDGVTIDGEFLPAGAVVWSAGNVIAPVGNWIGTQTDKAGRVPVLPDLSAPGHPEIFVIGDAMHLEQDGRPLPGVAQVAIQQGKYVAKRIVRRVTGEPDPPPFRYFDKGNMATVGRKFAIYDLDALRLPSGKRMCGPIRLYGFIPWLMWLVIHCIYLVGFANRYLVTIQWAWSYFTWQRGARIITPDSGPEAATAETLLIRRENRLPIDRSSGLEEDRTTVKH